MQTRSVTIAVPTALAEVRDAYLAEGESLWFVGGCVRDALKGISCSDVDLATTATPERQIAICDKAGIAWFGTGLQHGTITIVAGGESYEITTLRRDVETDGRHAEVEWTTDIVTDLGRRDLTVNAMAMTFDGTLVDPFDGRKDLVLGRVRFVGDAATRIQEDHLRILRWFRFLARFGSRTDLGSADLQAIRDSAHLLCRISVERIRAEMGKILAGPDTMRTLGLMHETGTLAAIGLERGNMLRYRTARNQTADLGALLAFWQGRAAPSILERWKTSSAEWNAGVFVASRIDAKYDVDRARRDLVDGGRRDLVLALLATNGGQSAVADMADWTVPVFPLKGRDLIAAGMAPGKAMGETLQTMRDAWKASGYALSRTDLLAKIEGDAR